MSRLLAILLLFALVRPAVAQEDSRTVFKRAAALPRGSAESIALFERYVALEPKDAWGYLALAEAQAAAHRFTAAKRSIAAAERLAPNEEDVAIVKQRVVRAQRAYLPTLTPRTSYTRDSDDNAALESTLTAGLRRKATRLELTGGLVNGNDQTAPIVRGRFRFSPNPRGLLADMRVQRTPLVASPLLVANEVVLSEARALIELPITGGLRIRANGQRGQLASSTSKNTRTGLGGGLIMRTGAASEMSGTVYRLTYDQPSAHGYFAPGEAQLAEVGTYAELYRFDPLTLAFDLGAGVQRVALHDSEFGEWKPALRAWGMVTVPMTSTLELNGEVDWYKSQLSTVATSGSWSSSSAAVSLKLLLGK